MEHPNTEQRGLKMKTVHGCKISQDVCGIILQSEDYLMKMLASRRLTEYLREEWKICQINCYSANYVIVVESRDIMLNCAFI